MVNRIHLSLRAQAPMGTDCGPSGFMGPVISVCLWTHRAHLGHGPHAHNAFIGPIGFSMDPMGSMFECCWSKEVTKKSMLDSSAMDWYNHVYMLDHGDLL